MERYTHRILQILCNLFRGRHLVHVVHNFVGESVAESGSDQLLHGDCETTSEPLVPGAEGEGRGRCGVEEGRWGRGQRGERWGESTSPFQLMCALTVS